MSFTIASVQFGLTAYKKVENNFGLGDGFCLIPRSPLPLTCDLSLSSLHMTTENVAVYKIKKSFILGGFMYCCLPISISSDKLDVAH